MSKLTKEDKIRQKLNDEDYVKDLKDQVAEVIEFSLVLNQEPENYVRERYTSRGRRFYNKKSGIMNDMNRFFKAKIDPEIHKRILSMTKESEYYVELECRFYKSIQKNESIKKSVKKEFGLLRPGINPDLDNYLKLLLDTLHGVVYDDDSRVTKLSGEKLYSLDPRTEIDVKILIVKEITEK